MISSKSSSRREPLCAILLISVLVMANCAPTTTSTRRVITKVETKAVAEPTEARVVVEKEVAELTEPAEVEAPMVTITPTSPPDLDPAEEWRPYRQEAKEMGDAELVPGYEPMRRGVAAMDPGLREMLDESGLKINTARTVVLAETTSLPQRTGFDPAAVLVGFVEQKADQPWAQQADFLVYDSGHGRRAASQPWQLTNAGTSTATANECPGIISRTYVTTQDNENNDHTGSQDGDMGREDCIYRNDSLHPIEFYIYVPSLSPRPSWAKLSLRVWDVDEEDPDCGERDAVYFNGHYVGDLRGYHETWTTSGLYELEPVWVLQGNNLVEIQVNTRECSDPPWCVAVQKGTLHLEGGSGTAYQRSSFKWPQCWPPGSTGYVVVEVDTTLDSQEVEVEINVIDAQHKVVVGKSRTKVIYSTEDDQLVFDLPIPANALPGDHTIQVIIHDTCSQTSEETQELTVQTDCLTVVERVAIAPVVAADPSAFDQAELEDLLRTDGVVLGMLVLETNAPDSLIPPGAYLERARFDGDESFVELINVVSGEIYEVKLLAEKVEDPTLDYPSASIFLGSKWCRTQIDGWLFCLPCFFWQTADGSLDECCRLLPACCERLPGCTP